MSKRCFPQKNQPSQELDRDSIPIKVGPRCNGMSNRQTEGAPWIGGIPTRHANNFSNLESPETAGYEKPRRFTSRINQSEPPEVLFQGAEVSETSVNRTRPSGVMHHGPTVVESPVLPIRHVTHGATTASIDYE